MAPYSEGSKFIRGAVRELVTTILPPVLLAIFLNVFVAEAALVEEGPSMRPNLYIDYRVMTEAATICAYIIAGT
jgi:signal peptidase I